MSLASCSSGSLLTLPRRQCRMSRRKVMAQGDELIQAFRELLERNIEQARTAYSLYLDTVADAMRAWSNSPTLDSRFKHVQELAIRLRKRMASPHLHWERTSLQPKTYPRS